MKIEINNLTKSFGDKKAVDIPAFTINKGDVLGLVGNNGAGKTTLFRHQKLVREPARSKDSGL